MFAAALPLLAGCGRAPDEAARRGRCLGGGVAAFRQAGDHARLAGAARFEHGAATERFALVDKAGRIRIDSHGDQP